MTLTGMDNNEVEGKTDGGEIPVTVRAGRGVNGII